MVNKLAKSLSAAAAVFAMAAVSLAPQSALAGIGKGSGDSSNVQDTFSLDIDTSSPYISDGPNQGTFTQAIPNARYQNYIQSRRDPSAPKYFDFNPGDLKISLIDLTPTEVQALNNYVGGSFQGKFDSQAVQYSASLKSN